jgi:hypothetical protein
MFPHLSALNHSRLFGISVASPQQQQPIEHEVKHGVSQKELGKEALRHLENGLSFKNDRPLPQLDSPVGLWSQTRESLKDDVIHNLFEHMRDYHAQEVVAEGDEKMNLQSEMKQLMLEVRAHWRCLSDADKLDIVEQWSVNANNLVGFSKSDKYEDARGPINAFFRAELNSTVDGKLLRPHLSTAARIVLESILDVRKDAEFLPEDVSNYLEELDSQKTGYMQIQIGGGPRSSALAVAEMSFIEEHLDDFSMLKTLGAKYDIQTVMFERHGANQIGRGNAWGDEQGGGTANTAAENSGIDYRPRLSAFYEEHLDQLLEQYTDKNAPSAVILKSAVDGTEGKQGEPVLNRAALTRAHAGLEELRTFGEMLEKTEQTFPEYRCTIITETSVTGLDLSSPLKPVVQFERTDGKAQEAEPGPEELRGDLVHLVTGTTLVSPIKDEGVAQRSFIQAMDRKALNKYLDRQGVLDEDGVVTPGTKLLLGGSGLSALDAVIAVDDSMKLFVLDPESPFGYRVSDWAMQNHRGAITFISRSEGFVPPRLSNVPNWTQDTEPLGTPRELHAATLHHDGEEVFRAWREIELADISVATNSTPSQVLNEGLSVEEIVARQYENALSHQAILSEAKGLPDDQKAQKLLEATKGLPEAASRQLAIGTTRGFYGATDPAKALKTMSETAPHTFGNRHSMVLYRAQTEQVTHPRGDTADNNSDIIKTFYERHPYIAASPFRVQVMAGMLFEAGIAKHVSCSYDNIRTGGEQDKALTLQTAGGRLQFDGFIVSKVQNRLAEPAIVSLEGQVTKVDPDVKALPEVTTLRRIIDKEGKVTNVFDQSLNAMGAWKSGDSKVGMWAEDIFHREAGHQVASYMAHYRMSIEHLKSVGHPDPQGFVQALYEKHMPSDLAYTAEVESFNADFDEMMAKAAFARVVRETFGDDPVMYRELMKQGKTEESRKAALAGQPDGSGPGSSEASTKLDGAREQYEQALDQRPEYAPASKDDYYRRFKDVPLEVHKKVYEAAFNEARGHATMNLQ